MPASQGDSVFNLVDDACAALIGQMIFQHRMILLRERVCGRDAAW